METKHDFTQGNILKKLVLFMVPIFGALVLQAMYGAVDLIIVWLVWNYRRNLRCIDRK